MLQFVIDILSHPWYLVVLIILSVYFIVKEISEVIWAYKENNKEEFQRNVRTLAISCGVLVLILFFLMF